MNDLALFTAVRAALLAGLADNGQSAVPVIQLDQPTLQGRPSGPALLFQKIGGDRRYGWVKREDVPDPDDADVMIHRETQFYESTLQVEALGPPATSDGTALPTSTASDLVNLAAGILQGDKAMAALRVLGIGVLRVGAVRNPFMKNDRDQYEAVPSFDLVVTHEQIMLSTTPTATVGELIMARV